MKIGIDGLEQTHRRYGMSHSEGTALIAVVKAALEAFPGPSPTIEQFGSTMWCPNCMGTGRGRPNESDYQPVEHLPDCPGMALITALKPFRENPDETYEEWYDRTYEF